MTEQEFWQVLEETHFSASFEIILNCLSMFCDDRARECNGNALTNYYKRTGNKIFKALEDRGYYEREKGECPYYAEGVLSQLPSVTPKPIECDDAISREAIIERLKKEDKILYTTTGLNYLIRVIEDLPPVTQKSGSG